MHGAERDSDALSSHVEEEGPAPMIGATSKQRKVAKGKAKLAFEVQQSEDHERLWDGHIIEKDDNHEHDSEYSINDLGSDTPTYNLDALLGNQSPTPVNNPALPNKPHSMVLLDEGYVLITGFQANPAFDSVQGDTSKKGSVQPSDHPWCCKSTMDTPRPQDASPAKDSMLPPHPVAEDIPIPPSRPISRASMTSASTALQEDSKPIPVQPILGVSADC